MSSRRCHRIRSSVVEYKPAAVFGTIRSVAEEALTRPFGVTVYDPARRAITLGLSSVDTQNRQLIDTSKPAIN
jgi:hypothetical protein